ncbi:MAG: hypothetical protein V9G12_04900 [Microthrixaceae bacterium]
MRRLARSLSIGGGAIAVLALSKVHARFIVFPHYDFTGSSRFVWAGGYVAFLALAAYALGLPDQPRNRRDAAIVGFAAALIAALGVSAFQLVAGDSLLPRFVVFGTVLTMIPIQVVANAWARRGTSRAEDRDRVLLVADLAEQVACWTTSACIPNVRHRSSRRLRPRLHRVGPADRRSSTRTRVGGDAHRAGPSCPGGRPCDRPGGPAPRVGVRIRTLQGFYEQWLGKLPLSELERNSLLFDIGEVHRNVYGRLKRLTDLALGTVGCLAF